MQALVSERNEIRVLSLVGRMDATTADVFGEACQRLLDENIKKITVDFSGVEYISSAGLRVILTMVKASRAQKGTLAFCALQPMVAEVFKISGFSSMFPIYATQDEAVSALA